VDASRRRGDQSGAHRAAVSPAVTVAPIEEGYSEPLYTALLTVLAPLPLAYLHNVEAASHRAPR